MNPEYNKDIPINVLHKKKLVKYCLDGLYNLKTPNKVIAFIIKGCHMFTPLFFFMIFMLAPVPIAVISLIPLFVALWLYLYFNGCFITTVENKLDPGGINIIDPYLYYLGVDITDKNRHYYTLQISGIYFAIVTPILLMRIYYYYKNKKLSIFY